jgi:hypothetical protein
MVCGQAIEERAAVAVSSPGLPWTVIAGVVLLSALSAGCIVVPVPVPEAEPRYSPAQLEVVGREATTASSIRAELGPPDIVRDSDRIWIYAWQKVSGMLIDVPVLVDDPATPGGAIVSREYLLALEFDADGRLRGKEFIAESPHGGSKAYCTRSGLCVAGKVPAWNETFGPADVFENWGSLVTVTGEMRERVTPLRPGRDQCLLTIWPSADWKRLEIFDRRGDAAPDALAVMVEGTVDWWHAQLVPLGAYAQMIVSAGSRIVSVGNPRSEERSAGAAASGEWAYGQASTATFQCVAGQQVYLAIVPTLQPDRGFPGAPRGWKKGFPIMLRAVDAAEARSNIATMPQLLPPQ